VEKRSCLARIRKTGQLFGFHVTGNICSASAVGSVHRISSVLAYPIVDAVHGIDPEPCTYAGFDVAVLGHGKVLQLRHRVGLQARYPVEFIPGILL
jgi:hypothetical protein